MLNYIAKTLGQVNTNIVCGCTDSERLQQLSEVLGMLRLYAATQWRGSWRSLCAAACETYREQWKWRYCCAMNPKDARTLEIVESWLVNQRF